MKQQPSAWGRPHAPAPPRWGRKILSLFLSVVLCLSMLPATALAEGTETGSLEHTDHTNWTEISSASALTGITSDENYYLKNDISLSDTWTPINGVNLCLNGHTITGADGKAVITVNSGVTFTLTDCAANPGKITHEDGKTGRGVYMNNGGTFYMYGGSIAKNTFAGSGAGVFVAGGGKFIMSGGSITENTASTNDGGGVYVNKNNDGKGQFIMNGGTITKNTAQGTFANGGGGVYVYGGTFEMSGGTIGGTDAADANTAKNGGGVYVFLHDSGSFTMSGGSITNNRATGFGGGVAVSQSTFKMSGGSITDNTATSDGGGVWTNESGTIAVSGTAKITNNLRGNVANNVYLPNGKTITIAASLNDTARIGVTKVISSGNPVQIATGATGSLADYQMIFSMDGNYGSDYRFTKENDNLRFGWHQHRWTYSESGATVTASCTGGCGTTGSVTINAPAVPAGKSEPVYDGQSKAAAVDDSSKWPDAAVSGITYYGYTENGVDPWVEFVQGIVPTNAGKYKATATVDGDKKISVEYTIQKADPKASDFTFTAPSDLTYNGSDRTATVTPKSGITGMGDVTVKYFKGNTQVDDVKDAGTYTVKVDVAEGDNYNAVENLTDSGWTFTIGKVDYPNTNTLTVAVPADMVSDSIYLPLPTPKGDASYDNNVVTSLATKTDESDKTLFPDNSFIWDRDGTGVTFKTNPVPAGYSATITFHINGGTNYNDYDFLVPVSVVARTQQALDVRMEGWTYGDAPKQPQYTKPEGLIKEPTITYAKKNADGSFTELTTVPTDAGDYKVTVVCETPFVIYSGFAEFSIAKRSSSSSGSPSYSVTTPDKTENGSVTISPKNAGQGSTVTITVTPDAGYVLGDLGVTDKGGKDVTLTKKSDTQYTFTMPSGGATVKASFVKDSAGQSEFADVKDGDYFYDAVRWAVEKGVTNGTDATHFSPDAACTRAQIVTFLWRATGSPEAKGVSGFVDVAEGSYYAKAVAWAVEQGITNGTDATHFSPDASCTRAQSVTFLYRALGQKPSGQAAFADVPAESYYADAVAWAAEKGITNGTGNGQFSPNAVCTRAQIVTFLYRAYQGK